MQEATVSNSTAITDWLPGGQWMNDLTLRHPNFVEGMARIGDAISQDGAVPKSYKLLFIAVIAAVKRDEGLVHHYLNLARSSGLSREIADSAAVGVLISRGVMPHRLLADGVSKVYGSAPAPRSGSGRKISIDVGASKEYFRDYFGFVPDYIQLLAESTPVALEGYALMRQVALGDTAMPPKYMELLLCAVNAAEYETRFVMIHARGARKAGADEAELVESCLTALPFAGVASWLPAADGILQSRADS